MRSFALRPASCRYLAILALLVPFALVMAQPGETPDEEAQSRLRERAENTVTLLEPLIELESRLEQQIAAAGGAQDAEPGGPGELARLQRDLQDKQAQISTLMTGVSEQDYQTLGESEFDLNSEVEQLIEPFLLVLNEATSSARQLERTRRDLDIAERRLGDAQLAIRNLNAVIAHNTNPAIEARLEQKLALWQQRLELHQTQVQALQQRMDDLQSEKISVTDNVNSAFQAFFRDRGISLALGIGAFVIVFFGLRFVGARSLKVAASGMRGKTFAIRLAGLLLAVAIVLASFIAMLVVFNLRNDWLLLGLATLLLLAAIWIVINTLPSLVQQATMLLNLGAVQEGERVLFNDVPYKVQRLDFFTDLVNPALDGGEFTLPVRELIGMHSRPAAADEAWFPSNKGDWVRLADDTAGQVVAQTPELVVIELLGGARKTYQTADYLAATPENLSQGYRVEIEFGIGYRHRRQATEEIIKIMRDGVERHFAELLDDSELRSVDIEFLRAGKSSLDYEVEIDIAGSAADRFEELERELARCLVMLANQHDWEIPYQQVVVHQGPQN